MEEHQILQSGAGFRPSTVLGDCLGAAIYEDVTWTANRVAVKHVQVAFFLPDGARDEGGDQQW